MQAAGSCDCPTHGACAYGWLLAMLLGLTTLIFGVLALAECAEPSRQRLRGLLREEERSPPTDLVIVGTDGRARDGEQALLAMQAPL